MRPNPLLRPLLAATALVALAAGALYAADAVRSTMKLKLRADGASDRVEIVDLDELEVGESRTYTTEEGRPVAVTRDDDGYAVEVDGKTIRVADDPDSLVGRPGMKMHRMEIDGDGHARRFFISDDESAASDALHMTVRRIEIDGDGEAKSLVIAGGPEADRLVVRRGPGGAHAFAFGEGAERVHFAAHGLLDRIEKNDKFQALDDTTRELVREIVREASAPVEWIESGDGDGVEVWLERHAASDDERP